MSIPHHSTHAAAVAKMLRANNSRMDIATELGLTPSAVTQLAATPAVQAAIAPSSAETELDNQYDRIEKKLLDQLERTTPLLMRPMEIAKVLTTINGAKRRGGALKQSDAPQQVLNLTLPLAIQNKFVLNQHNQVITAGSQDLVTIQSAGVSKLLEQRVQHALTQSNTSAKEEDEFGFQLSTSKG